MIARDIFQEIITKIIFFPFVVKEGSRLYIKISTYGDCNKPEHARLSNCQPF